MRLFLFAAFIVSSFLTVHAQDISRVRKYLDTLCSPSLHGRGYVMNGDQLAAAYIRDRFKEYNLTPLGDQYFQYFNISPNTFPGKLYLESNTKKYKPGTDYIVASMSSKGKGKCKIKYLDTTIFKSEEARLQFLKENNKKYAYVYEARHFDQLSALPLEYLENIYKARCVIELQHKKLVMGISSSQSGGPSYEVKKDVWDYSAKTIRYRIDATLIPEYKTQNIVGYVKGKVNPDSFIVITAHYDHLGRMGKETYFPGANDNASGISMLLELANHYGKTENQPDYSILFIAFSAEEIGLLGSKYFTDHPLVALKQMRFLINLDLLGTGDDGMMVVNGSVFEQEFKMLSQLNSSKGYLPAVKQRGTAANSDHFWFTQKGVHSFFFYTLGGIAAYHDVEDRPETLPLTKFKEVFGLIRDFVDEF